MRKLMYYDSDKFERGGRTFRVNMPHDDFDRCPWGDDDGAGIVTDWTSRDKAPGERLLCSDRSSSRFYDWAETMKKAKRDGWGLCDADKAALAEKLGRSPSASQIISEAVERDFDRMRRWCDGQWCYVGVIVTELESGESDSLWGIESDCADYIAELAHEMADAIGAGLDESLACDIAESRPDLHPDA